MAASDHLSRTQQEFLAARVNDPEIGGFTIKGTGEDPMAGPPVPGFLAGGIVGADNLPHPIEPSAIGEFHARGDVQAELANPRHYFGGWHSGAKGSKPDTSALDVSEYHEYEPSNSVSHNAALMAAYGQGVARNQEAIGHFATQADGSVNYDSDIAVEPAPPYGSRDLSGMIDALRSSALMKTLRPQA